MKHLILLLISVITSISFAQEKEELLALKKANNYVYEGNQLVEEDFVSAEMAYRKALSNEPTSVAGVYNLGNSYYESGNYEEALYRHQQAIKNTTSKSEKHKAFHNIGNILMKNKKCKEAVEAFKNALRNNPKDDETRYNLSLAKICAEEQKDQNKDDKENKDDNKDQENKDNKDKEGEDKEDKNDKGEEDKKEGDDEKDKDGEPKDEKDKKEDKGAGDKDEKKEQQKPKPQPGQLSPQQIKSLLEAMNNQEQKVQEKMNAEKQKGVKVKTEKDW
ncbi:tetratricopeptide repeat protein [uncultured Algibacter sp.]|uniref:tetratricopeptide repeat protein n=1 Tax=uncultured Algibacter sp. TaxID=298659 RepID=UPI0026035F1B|nr:tetratricopeptide repeat protein [uncultured Algibacter sp.]